jgi:hypothetical protein
MVSNRANRINKKLDRTGQQDANEPESSTFFRRTYLRQKAVGMAMLGLSAVLIFVMQHHPPSPTIFALICSMIIAGLYQLFKIH